MAEESYDNSINHENNVGLEVATSGEEGGSTYNCLRSYLCAFVDDDLMLRKLFARAVRSVMPEWDVQRLRTEKWLSGLSTNRAMT
jgi:hypothetical protein